MPADATISRRAQIQHTICEAGARRLGIDAKTLDPDTPLVELGADSLVLLQVARELELIFSIRITTNRLFEELSTVSALASHIDSGMPSEWAPGTAVSAANLAPIPRVERDGPVPLSFSQQRLWFLAQLEGVSRAYHIPGGVRLRGDLDRDALKRALDRIVSRHEALRTRFEQVEGQPIQVIAAADIGMVVHEHDLCASADVDCELARWSAVEAAEPFDLQHGPLIRARLLQFGEQEHVLLVTMHHIVSDGWSMGVLIREFGALYEAFARVLPDPLPPLPIQYADYAVWQRGWLDGERAAAAGRVLEAALAGAPALLELPADRARPAVQDYAGAGVRGGAGRELTDGLRELSAGATGRRCS